MNAPQHLQENFDQGRRFLVIAGEQVFLAEESAVFKRTDGCGAAQFAVVDLERLWKLLPLLTCGQTEFSKKDVATAGGVSTDAVVDLCNAGLLQLADGRRRPKFATLDIFIASLICSLRRRGASAEAIAKVAAFIREGQSLEAAAR